MSSARDLLISTLRSASSQDVGVIKEAEKQLKGWETSPEFYLTLQDVFCDATIDFNTRWLSGIYLKNGIDRFWRRTARNAIPDNEKIVIRNRLLSSVREERKELSVQNAVIAAKVARFDFPQEWPELLIQLLSILQQGRQVGDSDLEALALQQRGLQHLNLVVKALCSKTLAASRRQFQQISPELFHYVAFTYMTDIEFALGHLQHYGSLDATALALTASHLENSILALKCLRRIIVHGLKDIHKSAPVVEFFEKSRQYLQGSCDLFFAQEYADLTPKIATHMLKLGKLYREVQLSHFVAFTLIPTSTDILRFYFQVLAGGRSRIEASNHSELLERLAIQGLLLIKQIIKYKSSTDTLGGEDDADVQQATNIVNGSLLRSDFLHSLSELLITQYLPLSESDQVTMTEDAESWIEDEEADHWEFAIRPCAEKVVMDLLARYPEAIGPIVLRLLHTTENQHDPQQWIVKDCTYCAVGLGAHYMSDFDFDTFLRTRLAADVSNPAQSNIFIRTRVTSVIGKWVGAKCAKSSRPNVYNIMVRCLDPKEALIVRLSAATNLKYCIDDWDFEREDFTPFLDQIIHLLTTVLGDVSEFGSKMRIMNTLSIIIERMQEQIAPFATHLTQLLPPLWNAAGGEHLFRSSILVTITKLVASLKDRGSDLQPFVVPLIRHSVDRSLDSHVYLLEDGLDLWWTTLQTSYSCSEELFHLMPSAVDSLEYGSETLRKVLKIVESYIYLVPEQVTHGYAFPLLDAFTRLLGELKIEATAAIIHVVDVVIQGVPVQQIASVLAQTGLLTKVTEAITADKDPAVFLALYLSLLSRIVINDVQAFFQLLQHASQMLQTPQPTLLSNLLNVWIDKFDNISHPRQRKLNCMALTTLVATGETLVLQRLGDVMAIWMDVLGEVRETGGGDVLIYWQDDVDEEVEDAPENHRKREWLQRDPIHSAHLTQYIQVRVQEAEKIAGEAFQKTYLSAIDPLIEVELSKTATSAPTIRAVRARPMATLARAPSTSSESAQQQVLSLLEAIPDFNCFAQEEALRQALNALNGEEHQLLKSKVDSLVDACTSQFLELKERWEELATLVRASEVRYDKAVREQQFFRKRYDHAMKQLKAAQGSATVTPKSPPISVASNESIRSVSIIGTESSATSPSEDSTITASETMVATRQVMTRMRPRRPISPPYANSTPAQQIEQSRAYSRGDDMPVSVPSQRLRKVSDASAHSSVHSHRLPPKSEYRLQRQNSQDSHITYDVPLPTARSNGRQMRNGIPYAIAQDHFSLDSYSIEQLSLDNRQFDELSQYPSTQKSTRSYAPSHHSSRSHHSSAHSHAGSNATHTTHNTITFQSGANLESTLTISSTSSGGSVHMPVIDAETFAQRRVEQLKFGGSDGFWECMTKKGGGDEATLEKIISNYFRRGGSPNVAKQTHPKNRNSPILYGYGMIHAAIIVHSTKALEHLLNAGANLHAMSLCVSEDDKSSPLYMAAKHNFVDGMRMLLQNGADLIEARGSGARRRTALHAAVEEGHLDMARLIIAASEGVLVNMSDGQGQAPVHVAAAKGNLSVLHMLIREYNAAFNLADMNGETPLHIAARYGEVAICQALVNQYRMDPNTIATRNAGTPVDSAKSRSQRKAVDFLTSVGGKTQKQIDKENKQREKAIKNVEAMESILAANF